jgi:hypothetical protein
MSVVKISELPSAGTLTGDEVLPVNQGGVTKKATLSALLAVGAGLSIVEHSTAYEAILEDANTGIANPNGNGANIFTIPSNDTVPYDVGDFLTFINRDDTKTLVVEIAVDTMYNTADGSTGSITLNPRGMLTAVKTATNEWMALVSGAA